MKMKMFVTTAQALFVLAFTTSLCSAEDANKPEFPLSQFQKESENKYMFELAVALASLPSNEVLYQGVCKSAPADGGFETVFEYGGMRYTSWLYKTHDTKQNRFRVYYYPVGKKSEVRAITDFNIDGEVNSALPREKSNEYGIIQTNESNPHPSFKDVCVPDGQSDTLEAREKAFHFWHSEYFKVISDIRAVVYTIEHRQKPLLPGLTRFVYDPVGRLLVSLSGHSGGGLTIEEFAYDAVGNQTNARMRALVKSK